MSGFIPLKFERLDRDEQFKRAHAFFEQCKIRRTVREFSSENLPEELIDLLIRTAGTAPSGANKQPWTFVVVSDPDLKKRIRIAAEKEEKLNYDRRFTDEWLQDLYPLGTDWHKEFLEEAPCLIVVFKQDYGLQEGRKKKHYYVNESVGISVGFLLAAIHDAGLVSLTHTPSPMGFLQEILQRPKNEKAFLLIPVGYPKDGTLVPDIHRKPLNEILVRK
ncbi:nitroreductase family protein [bacterium]|nr:nitroreductase family protein [bacterium]MCI0615822.1 nitroreductase family protein [bacterium]